MKKKLISMAIFSIMGINILVGQKFQNNNIKELTLTTDKLSDKDSLIFIDTFGKNITTYDNLSLNNTETACLSKEPTIENYIDDADIIIKGEVISIKYFDYNGIPWSKLNVLVKKVISGNATLNQNIDIYVMEGYEYNNTRNKNLSAVSGDDLGLHNIGDTSVFVLTEEDGNNIFEKGSYRRTFGCFSEYRYIESENVYNIYDTKIGSKLAEKNLETTIDLYAE